MTAVREAKNRLRLFLMTGPKRDEPLFFTEIYCRNCLFFFVENVQFLGANGELSAACMKSTVLNVTEIGMKA